jgi:hypothetical protein
VSEMQGIGLVCKSWMNLYLENWLVHLQLRTLSIEKELLIFKWNMIMKS